MLMTVIESIIKKLLPTTTVGVGKIPNDTAATWLTWQMIITPLIKPSAVLLMAIDDKQQLSYQQNLLFWQKIYPANISINIWPTQASTILNNLISATPQLIIFSLQNLPINLPNKSIWQNELITNVKINNNYLQKNFLKKITQLGYERQTRVFAKGEYAKRGEIIDIFPINFTDPVRIIWKQNKIEEIFSFAILSQKHLANLTDINIVPKSLPPGTADINEYLPTNSLFLSSQTSSIPIQSTWKILFLNLASQDGINTDFTEAPSFRYTPNELDNWLKNKTDWFFILTNKTENYFQQKISNLKIMEQPLVQSLVSQQLKLAILTERELPANNQTLTASLNKLKQNFKIDDYVVHIDHGVGKMTGIIKQNFDGTTRDFFVISYADRDRLYVPVEKADRLEKYIGLTRPTINRLSSSSWQQLKNKIKTDLLSSAREIIQTQAQRETGYTEPLLNNFPEEKSIIADFPYQDTIDQKKAWADIVNDLKNTKPMDRLICGDVGFGKTELAIRTAARIIFHGGQVALLCPTTILAQQHFDTFNNRLQKFGIQIDLLTRWQEKKKQTEIIENIKLGRTDVVIGTHRILSDDINFKNLQLLIIDEEQKFGVIHKEKLKKHRQLSHVLTLSATPIPRTLYFSVAGIKPVSLIQTPPPGRLPIISSIEPYDENKIKHALQTEFNRQGQTYYLYNKVETMASKVKQLAKLVPEAKIAFAHGQMPGKELSQIMHQFDEGKIDILVCSTIIENGLDLPNVNTLIVEQAANFGLAQLYQLRGRIGRGNRQAYAYFFYSSQKLSGLAAKRLSALQSAQSLGSGLELARRDMEIRGIGNLLGKKQHGHIKAVGLNLYLRLLDQAVQEIKTGNTEPEENDIQIQLPLTYYIPESLISAPDERFDFYQKLSSCKTNEELLTLSKNFFSNKTLPMEYQNLLRVLHLKIICQQKGINSINVLNIKKSIATITIIFNKKITSEIINNIKKLNFPWTTNQQTLKIKISTVNNDWLEELIATIKKI